jgi:muramoyltetrapeptide carboxypeptidase LdcA involved in peptidoglycan recycling
MSRFHLIAPSGYCINQQAAALGVQRLALQGHQVDNREVITRRDQRFAGDDRERLNDLNALVALEGADIIVLPVRGGYGASRLLEMIDWPGLVRRQQSQPLLICGHSDFTAVQMGLLARGGVITFSARCWLAISAPHSMILPSAISGRRCVSLNWSSSGTAKAPLPYARYTLGRKSGDAGFAYWHPMASGH